MLRSSLNVQPGLLSVLVLHWYQHCMAGLQEPVEL